MSRIAKIIFVLILIGICITGYLAFVHFSGSAAICPLEPRFDCNSVLNSSYATAVGIPVAIWGLLAYLVLFVCLIVHEKKESRHNDLLLLGVVSVGVIAAGFYSALMFFRLGVICIWCETSHLTMLVLFVLMARHIRPHWSFKKIFFVWISLLIVGSVGSLFALSDPSDDFRVVELAKCLSAKKIVMYGAYWCPHCKEQKRLFGSAFSNINYVECADTSQPRVQLDVCKKANIKGYPTWVFGDKRIERGASLEELAERSGCSFKN